MDFQATSPLLMVSVEEETWFVSLNGEKTVPKLKNSQKDMCIGSSHGWLILLDESSEPYLLNPFNQSRIQLPKKFTFPHINRVTSECWRGGECIWVSYTSGFTRRFGPTEYKWPVLSIKKAILSANPSTHEDFVVAVIYGNESRIAYCRNGDDEWREIQDGDSYAYFDIACPDGDLLYALGKNGTVEVWDLTASSIPLKKKDRTTQPSCPKRFIDAMIINYPGRLYARKFYLVPCAKSGQIFLVVRYVGKFVTSDGIVVSHPSMVWPYKTIDFHVYRLDTTTSAWKTVKSLDNLALFLGGNHSVSMLVSDHSDLKADAIYFTDNYWARMYGHYLYGAHDMGVFSLEDETIHQFLNIDLQKIKPPSFWLVPESSKLVT
ncbi:PREDICTED: putative F-box/kelch-repeat protein At4g12810 [Ipomoea nil]|uniref:putative F-box/kelch-repeat protein At4g12810 n=1 Tax=Ipomoea nil TaxID=35883 RepID=UPI000901C13F|nr:PREDICTED: putative F-box/kelch-repeat protein At4g12810 [Ipomoea nil]